MMSANFAFPVQSIVRITYAIVVMEHVRVDVCLEVQDIGVMNNVEPIALNASSFIRRIAYLAKVNFTESIAIMCAAKIANLP